MGTSIPSSHDAYARLFLYTSTGYNRTFIYIVPGFANNLTAVSNYIGLDFIAKSATVTVSFMGWGHIQIMDPEGTVTVGATEMAMDDVILAKCAPRKLCVEGDVL